MPAAAQRRGRQGRAARQHLRRHGVTDVWRRPHRPEQQAPQLLHPFIFLLAYRGCCRQRGGAPRRQCLLPRAASRERSRQWRGKPPHSHPGDAARGRLWPTRVPLPAAAHAEHRQLPDLAPPSGDAQQQAPALRAAPYHPGGV